MRHGEHHRTAPIIKHTTHTNLDHQSTQRQKISTQNIIGWQHTLDHNMWHKAPCSSRDYSRVRESGPRKRDEGDDDDGDVDEDD